MELFLNGEKIQTIAASLDQLIDEKGFDADGLIVELNIRIVKKKDWEKTFLNQDDRIECVTFVGGG